MSKFDKLHAGIEQGNVLLGVGPMSLSCVDVVIEVANEYKVPMQLIASRRQVECRELGGGYVTDTETLAEYVKSKDQGEYVFLARDHGGPWQGANEQDLDFHQAFQNACVSYDTDIQAGFDILHIDPSLKSRPFARVLSDVRVLYDFCELTAKNFKKDIIYEVGTEEHSGQITTTEAFEKFVQEMKKCPKVKFAVGNMGLYVKELENVGKFDEKQAQQLVGICNSNNLYLKGHNSDYCGFEVLNQKVQLGVHSLNVAPEFGVLETKELLKQFDEKNRKRFIEIAVQSNKWKKWLKPENKILRWKLPDEYLATICGHYIFNDPEVIAMRKEDVNEEKVKDKLRWLLVEEYLWSLGWEV